MRPHLGGITGYFHAHHAAGIAAAAILVGGSAATAGAWHSSTHPGPPPATTNVTVVEKKANADVGKERGHASTAKHESAQPRHQPAGAPPQGGHGTVQQPSTIHHDVEEDADHHDSNTHDSDRDSDHGGEDGDISED